MEMIRLFSEVVDIVFRMSDGSEILCRTSLNPDILQAKGYANVDGFVDFLSSRIIPQEMFEQEFSIEPQGEYQLNSLDAIFQTGGKVHWDTI